MLAASRRERRFKRICGKNQVAEHLQGGGDTRKNTRSLDKGSDQGGEGLTGYEEGKGQDIRKNTTSQSKGSNQGLGKAMQWGRAGYVQKQKVPGQEVKPRRGERQDIRKNTIQGQGVEPRRRGRAGEGQEMHKNTWSQEKGPNQGKGEGQDMRKNT